MSEPNKPRSRKNRKGAAEWWIRLIGLIIVSFLLIGGISAVAYMRMGRQYREVFFPQTTINGIDASNRTVEEVKKKIAEGIESYQLTIEERGGKKTTISIEDVGLHSVFDGTLEKMLAEQNPNEWLRYSREPQTYEIQTMIDYDKALFEKMIDELPFLQEENVTRPQDAYLSEYTKGAGYSIIPEVEGNELDPELVKKVISHAVLNLKETVNLEEEDCYRKPQILQTDENLQNKLAFYNQYANVKITLDMGEGTYETLDSETVHSWVTIRDDLSVSVDSDAVDAYVKSVAQKYNTAYTKRSFKTTTGQTVQISKGDYGWRVNQPAEKAALLEMVKKGESGQRTVEYYQRGVVHSDKDWGSTYVEINLTAQHLYFYKNGKLLVESDFVSGNSSKGYDTPAGIYGITYTEKNAVLKGEDYRTPVSFWMPFNGGIGLHDATWRSSFGGAIYKTNGSHGCVNLPYDVAKIIFENIKKNDPVICYHLPGTESKKTSSGKTEETKPAETKPAETKPAETKPAETKPVESKPTETKPADPKPVETKPEETKPVEIKPQDPTPPWSPYPGEPKPAETKPAETKPMETNPVGPNQTEPKPDETLSSPGANLPKETQSGGPAGPGNTEDRGHSSGPAGA